MNTWCSKHKQNATRNANAAMQNDMQAHEITIIHCYDQEKQHLVKAQTRTLTGHSTV